MCDCATIFVGRLPAAGPGTLVSGDFSGKISPETIFLDGTVNTWKYILVGRLRLLKKMT